MLSACSLHVRQGLKEGLEKANSDPAVKSIIISGKKKFLGGADIKEFSTFSTAKSGKFSTVNTALFVLQVLYHVNCTQYKVECNCLQKTG